MHHTRRIAWSLFLLLAMACAASAADAKSWQSFITPKQLYQQLENPALFIIDVRAEEKYRAGHLPGAVNLPGSKWRTGEAKPGEGDSQYIFRDGEGRPDVARYEQLLSEIGLRNDHEVVIYGEHAGKADGSVPAMILNWLGHPKVAFLDGIGIEQWRAAGYPLERSRRLSAMSSYAAAPKDGFIWTLDDVLEHLRDDQVVFYDTRSPEEFRGTNLRDNKRGGHIPGAVLIDYTEFLDPKTKTVRSRSEIELLLAKQKITPDKQIVLYCQTATRVSLPALALKDLGYTNVAIYDASWHEYGNRADTPIAGEKGAAEQSAQASKREGSGSRGSL